MNYRNLVPGRRSMDHIDATQRLTRTNRNNIVRGQLTDGGLNLPTTQSLHYDAPWCLGNTNDLQRSTLHHRDATYRPQTDAAPRHSADQIQQHPNAVGFNDRNRSTAPDTHTARSYKTANEQLMDGHYSDALLQGLLNGFAPSPLITRFPQNYKRHTHNLAIDRPRLDLFKSSLHYSDGTLWNRLPPSVKTINSRLNQERTKTIFI